MEIFGLDGNGRALEERDACRFHNRVLPAASLPSCMPLSSTVIVPQTATGALLRSGTTRLPLHVSRFSYALRDVMGI